MQSSAILNNSTEERLDLYTDWKRVRNLDGPSGNALRITINSPPPDNKLTNIADYASKFKFLTVNFVNNPEQIYDLSLLQSFDRVDSVQILAHEFTDFEQLRYIPDGISELKLCDSSSVRLSLSFLSRFEGLRKLELERHTKHIESLSELKHLETLKLRYISMPDLSFFGSQPLLKRLEIRLGGITDLNVIAECEALEYLELWAINELENVDFIAEMRSLKKLELDQLSKVRNVKSLKTCKSLSDVSLVKMKRLESLSWISDIPNLEKLSVTETTHLGVDDFKVFVGHKKLKYADFYLGRENSEPVRKLLQFPEIEN